MTVDKLSIGQINLIAHTGAGASRAALDDLETCIAAGVNRIEIDCAEVAAASPELLYLLSQICERCADALVPVRLASARWSLLNLMEILFPPIGNMRLGDLGVLSPATVAVHSELVPVAETELGATRDRLLHLIRDIRLSDLTVYLLRTLFEEATCNIRLHSGLTASDRVFSQIRIETSRTAIVLAYQGADFDPTQWTEQVQGASRDPGDTRPPFGIKVLARLSHMMRYIRADDALNVLVLSRKKE